MEVMYLLIAFSLVIASGFLGAFIWAVRSGQYDDRDTPSIRMLIDDILPEKKNRSAEKKKTDGVGQEGEEQEIHSKKSKPRHN